MFGRAAMCAGLLLALGLLWPQSASAGAPAGVEIPREEIPELLRKAKSAPTAQDRVQAIRTLGSLSDSAVLRQFRIVEEMIKLTRSTSTGARERKALLEALRSICLRDKGFHTQVSGLMLEVLGSPRELVVLRIETLEFFRVTIVDPEAPSEFNAMQAILMIANGPRDTPVLVAVALKAIGDIAPIKGIDVLKRAVMDSNAVVRRAGVKALARYLEKRMATGGKQTVIIGVLQKLAADKELPVEVRVMALNALGRLARSASSPLEIVRAIQPVLEKAEDPDVAEAAALALGLAADRTAADALIEAFGRFKGGDKEQKVRVAVCRSLGEMFDDFARARDTTTAKKVADFLIKVLQDAEEGNPVRSAAAFALGDMNQRLFDRRAAARALVEVLLDDKTADAGLKRVAQVSLTFVTPTVQETPEDWKAWLDKNEDILRGG